MPKMDWPVKTLGEVCDLVGGGTPSKDRLEFYGGEIPWATVRDLNVEVLRTTEHSITAEAVKSSSSNIIPAGSVVIATRVGLGKAVKIAQDTAINQDLRGLVVKKPKELIADYLYWWYLSTVHLVVAAGTGATVQGVKLPFVSGLAIPVPPLDEQKRIVALLDAATAHVTELTACYEQARTEANNLFTSALRDALAPSDSWPVKRLGDLCLFVRGPFGGSLKKSVFVSTGHAVYEQQHAISGKFDKFRYFVSASKFQEMKRFEVFPGDILMSCSGTIGKTVIVPVGAPAGIINQALLKLSCSEKLNNQYLCVWMRSIYFQEAVFASVVGVALQNVASVAILKNIPISLPPMEQQKQIVAQLDLMRSKTSEMVSAYDAKLQAAKDLRQSILEAAFAGDL